MRTLVRDDVAVALFGQTRRRVLALLFGSAGEAFYLRQIARETDSGTGALQRELSRLTAAGVIRRSRRGNQVHFEANPTSPVFEDLRGLMAKTAGIADVLRAGLAELWRSEKLRAAFVYGSIALGKQQSSSDIDLFVIGPVKLRELAPLLRPLEERLGREINPSVYTANEVTRKVAGQSGFVERVMSGPKILLYGSQNELDDLAGKPLARATRHEPEGNRRSS